MRQILYPFEVLGYIQSIPVGGRKTFYVRDALDIEEKFVVQHCQHGTKA